MRALCIVPCGSKKVWDKNPNAGPTKAGEVYIGPFAAKCRAYAGRFHPKAWCILSAKYGFLFPDDIIPGTYNVSFNDRTANPIGEDELIEQIRRLNLDRFERVVVLGGKKYVEKIKRVFCPVEVASPLGGCRGIGYMMQKLNTAILNGKQF